MKILSIDVSGQTLSIALLIDERVVEKEYPSGKNNSDNIIPQIQIMMNNEDLDFRSLDGVAFGSGPGSFTGLRIAAGVAYGIAFANNLPIVGVNILKAIAKKTDAKFVIACIDARMSQLYIGAYQKIDNKYIPIIEDGLYDPSDLPSINAIEPVLIGSGVKSYRKLLEEKYGAIGVKLSYENNMLASSIAKIAKDEFSEKFDLNKAELLYIRNKVADTLEERKALKK
jgi:tRNA threonylcarbamoyladenosine biosynthesis protein TsaB|tara:strand:+ start:82 stop:762 length:681 start_codon:yes stop_codon:yes gene_type:complete